MKTEEIREIISTEHFQLPLEKYLVKQVTQQDNENPFHHATVTREHVLSTIITCTVLIVTVILLLHGKERGMT